MVFNSLTFLAFLTVVLLVYYRLEHKGQNWLLLGASYLFYGWWDYRFLGLLLFTTVFDYWCARWIEAEPNANRRRLYLTCSMIINLGVLSLFKYFNFFAASLEHVLAFVGMKTTFPILHVILPVGISFYTFLSMSYTIDVYRGELKASRSLVDFMLYVAFFPHLVAGPIVRASLLLPQCQKKRTINPDEVLNGIWLILMGYVKKVVIADRLAGVVNWGFAQPQAPFPDMNSWLILYAFAFQIYGDFAGYSDIARGLSKLMGFELVVNFKAPYLVTNPSAFWQNWHISLSTWLRDYLYIPLGGNRKGPWLTYRNLMITMLLGGLWHGAGAAFILWGLYHGLLLALHRAWQDLTGRRDLSIRPAAGSAKVSAPPPRFSRLGTVALVLIFFHITCIGWLLFRAGSLPPQFDQVAVVRDFLQSMVNPRLAAGVSPLVLGIFVLGGLALFFQWKHETMDQFSKWPMRWQSFGVMVALAAITSLGIFEGAQFIYFQF